MGLINCPDCGKEVSDKSTHCIHCGCPINQSREESTLKPEHPINTESDSNEFRPCFEAHPLNRDSNNGSKTKKTTKGWLIVLIISLIAMVIGGLVSGGSRTSRSYPKTFNDAYNEYQNGNKAPLEGFYKWLEDNP